MKASPSLKGVIIDKKLFSRVIKNRSSKLADKALLPKIDDEFESKVADLKRILVKKLMVLTEGKVSQGVKDYLGAEVIAKGSKFSASDFDSLDFTAIQLSDWTNDDHANGMIRDLILNFIKKYKELDAELKRKKFAITIGDELPAGIIQMAKVPCLFQHPGEGKAFGHRIQGFPVGYDNEFPGSPVTGGRGGTILSAFLNSFGLEDDL